MTIVTLVSATEDAAEGPSSELHGSPREPQPGPRSTKSRMKQPIAATTITALLLSGCGLASASSAGQPGPSPTTRDVDGCPMTVAPQPPFVPPEPYPPDPGFGNAWYGTPELWTILEPQGQVWTDLPVAKDGSVGDKTLWFSDSFSTASGEDFSGDADITVTAVRLDGSARRVVEEGGVPSFNRDINNFVLVGLVLPAPGCWQVNATYKGAELSYVLLVED